MHDLMFQHHTNITIRSTYNRDASPDSVIFSNFSLLSSSASVSVDRCSSVSDVVDRDSVVSEMSQKQHSSGRGVFSSTGGPDLDPDPDRSNDCVVVRSGSQHLISKKVEKAKGVIGYTDAETDSEKNQTLDSARSSFSQALKDCQYRKSRSEILLRKSDRRRPTSLDLNNQVINLTSSSPRLAMKSSVSSRRTNMFPSPVTPNYRPVSGMQKGWSSERVPLHGNSNRRHVSSGLISYNNGKTLPSKWEDAERWICSPVSGDDALRPSCHQPQRRIKSKSGPLGPPGSAYNPMYSPAVHMFDGRHDGSLLTGSPFLSGVNASDGLSIRYHDQHDSSENFPSLNEPCMARSVSVHGCSESLSQSLLRITQDGEVNGVTDAGTNISRDVSRRDMATQMSPEGSPYTSPTRRNSNSISLSSSTLPVETRLSKADVRDVQVDDQVSLSRWSKKSRIRIPGRRSDAAMLDDWKRKAIEVRAADWEVSEMTTNLSKVKREEAKITAWENLQKARAEAAIRKLEMKLEKKRSSSMDKIMNKLRSAQKKAQEMRGAVLSNQKRHQAAARSTSHKAISLIRTPQIGSLSGCFTCHAF